MKRDIHLVKEILSLLEDSETIVTEMMFEEYSPFPNYSDYDVTYHVCLLHEAAYITGGVFMSENHITMEFATLELTWQGHEFLDVLRDKEVLSKIMSLSKDGITSLSFTVIKDLARKLIESKAEKLLGLVKQ